MNKISKYILNISIVVILTFMVVFLLFQNDSDKLLAIINNMDYQLLLIPLILSILGQVLMGVIITILARISNRKYKLFDGVLNVYVARLFSSITPSSTGGQLAQIYAFKRQGVEYSDSASVIWMDYFIYQIVLCTTTFCLFCLKFLYFYNHHSNFFIIAFLGFLINVLVIISLYAIVKFPKFYYFITNRVIMFLAKIKIVKNVDRTITNINVQIKRFELEIVKLKQNKKKILICLLLFLFRFIIVYSIPYFCFKAIGYDVNLNQMLDVIALSSFVIMVNSFFPMPGASGGTELTFIMMFQTIFAADYVKVAVIVWRFTTFYFPMLLGLIAFMIVKLKKRRYVNEDSSI